MFLPEFYFKKNLKFLPEFILPCFRVYLCVRVRRCHRPSRKGEALTEKVSKIREDKRKNLFSAIYIYIYIKEIFRYCYFIWRKSLKF